MTMVYNESTNLPIWLRHYRRIAPGATLFVIDHASDDGSTALLYGAHKIPLPRHELDERDLIAIAAEARRSPKEPAFTFVPASTPAD